MNTKDYLTVREASELLGVHVQTIWTLIRRNTLTTEEAFGVKVLRRADIEAYRDRTRPDGVKPTGRPRAAHPDAKRL